MRCTNERGQFCEKRNCENCGFNPVEAKRRKNIPLTLCADGLRRKVVGVKREK